MLISWCTYSSVLHKVYKSRLLKTNPLCVSTARLRVFNKFSFPAYTGSRGNKLIIQKITVVLSLNGHLCLNISRCPVPTPRTPNKTNGCLYQHISINMVSPLNTSRRYPVTYHTNTYTAVRNTAPHLLQALHCNISHANYSKCVMVSHFMNGVGRILQPGIMNSVWLAETLTLNQAL